MNTLNANLKYGHSALTRWKFGQKFHEPIDSVISRETILITSHEKLNSAKGNTKRLFCLSNQPRYCRGNKLILPLCS